MTCVTKTSLATWLGANGRAEVLPSPPSVDGGSSVLKLGKGYLGKLAYHLKGFYYFNFFTIINTSFLLAGQLEGGADISFSQWTSACFFRVFGSGLRKNQEFLMLERLAVGARTPIRVLDAEFCSGLCSAPARYPYWIHVKVYFVSTWNFYAPEETPLVYLKMGHKVYHLCDVAAFYLYMRVQESALHPWESEASVRTCLSERFPNLVVPADFLGSIRRPCFETDRSFKVIFFLSHGYVGQDTLKSFQGLVRAGTWGRGDSAQVVIVAFGTQKPRFHFLSPEAIQVSEYKFGKTGLLSTHLDPENLKHLLEPTTSPSTLPLDTGSPSQCPCQFGETLSRNLPPAKLCRPVGYNEAPADLESNLRLLGLLDPDLSRILDLCTWLSCVCFDIER